MRVSERSIEHVLAFEALDSRGRPTVACVIELAGGAQACATVPSGASTGRHEAHERRDGGARYGGRGVRSAVAAVNGEIAALLRGRDAADQAVLDAALRDLDGTPSLSRLGANAILAASVASALAAAEAARTPLWRLLAPGLPPLLPLPMVNVLSGGAHAGGAVDVQDVLVIPLAARTFAEAIEHAARVRHGAAAELRTRGHDPTLVADEGGLAAPLASNEEALEVASRGLERSGIEAALALDVAATQLLDGAGYWLALRRPDARRRRDGPRGGRLGAALPARLDRGSPRRTTRRTSAATAARATPGAACASAVAAVNGEIAALLRGRDAADQAVLDAALRDLDGTPALARLGANAVLAASVRLRAGRRRGRAHAALAAARPDRPPLLPLPMVNVLSGGAHAGRAVDVQDVLVIPLAARTFAEAIEHAALRARTAPRPSCARAATRPRSWPTRAAWPRRSPPTRRRSRSRAAASSARASRPRSRSTWRPRSSSTATATGSRCEEPQPGRRALAREIAGWARRYPLVSIEDPLGEDDWEAWRLAPTCSAPTCSCSATTSSRPRPTGSRTASRPGVANAVLVKPNQAGTLSDARETLELAQREGYATVVSARSGDSEDAWLADLAVGWRSGQIKVGSTQRSERTAKWNRLLRIEAECPDARARAVARRAAAFLYGLSRALRLDPRPRACARLLRHPARRARERRRPVRARSAGPRCRRARPGESYASVAAGVVGAFAGDELEPALLERLCAEAYAGFRHPAVCPLVQLDADEWLLELFHGPTLAFKDLALQLVGRLFDHVLSERDERITVLVATSGDTGSAAISGLASCSRAEIVVLYPGGPRERRPAAADDDGRRARTCTPSRSRARSTTASASSRQLFGDAALRERAGLAAMNSINWARIAAQVAYYVWATASLGGRGARVRRAHRQLRQRALRLGRARLRHAARAARDRLERQRHPAAPARERAAGDARRRAHAQPEHGHPDLVEPRAAALRALRPRSRAHGPRARGLRADGLAHARRRRAGRRARAVRGRVAGRRRDARGDARRVPPQRHAARSRTRAVGLTAGRARKAGRDAPLVALATAHPAKFPEAVERATGIAPALPPPLADLHERPERSERVPADADAVRHLVERAR